MADRLRKVDYFYVMVPNTAGQGSKILAGLAAAGVNLLAFSGFPSGGKGQIDLVPESSGKLRRAARKKLKLSKKKSGFLLQGKDRVGAMTKPLATLAKANAGSERAADAAEATAGDVVRGGATERSAATGALDGVLGTAPPDATGPALGPALVTTGPPLFESVSSVAERVVGGPLLGPDERGGPPDGVRVGPGGGEPLERRRSRSESRPMRSSRGKRGGRCARRTNNISIAERGCCDRTTSSKGPANP